jgi:hypothetical protein
MRSSVRARIDEVAVEAIHAGAGGKAMSDLPDNRVAGLVAIRVEGYDFMAESLQRPQTIKRGVVR